jgi:hypothetical protein
MNASQDSAGEQDVRFRLDPTQMPRRVELDIPEELLERLIQQAERCNRSLPELIEYILAQSCMEIAEEA